jgi:hypothetical protein
VFILLCFVTVFVDRWSREEIEGLKTPQPWKSSGFHQSRKTKSGSKRKFVKLEVQRQKRIEDIAREAALFDCDCKKTCLASVGDSVTESIDMLADYMTPWFNMTSREHKGKFYGILEGCAHGVTAGGHLNKR